MVQDRKPLTLRQIEILAALTARGGRSSYEKLYRTVKESPLSRDLKLSGKATFDKELDNLIRQGYIEKIKLGKRNPFKINYEWNIETLGFK